MLLAGYLARLHFATEVPAQGIPADRKDAQNVIPDGSSRFTLLPGFPVP